MVEKEEEADNCVSGRQCWNSTYSSTYGRHLVLAPALLPSVPSKTARSNEGEVHLAETNVFLGYCVRLL